MYLARPENTFNGSIAKYEVNVSDDGRHWGDAVARGTFAAKHDPQRANFGRTVTARYVRLTALSEVHGKPWASAAEIGVIAGK